MMYRGGCINMEIREGVRNTVAEAITKNIFKSMALLKKRVVRFNALQSEHGIPLSHVQVLSLLNEVDSLTITEISQKFDIAKPNITPLVDRMIAAGLVDRVRSSTDRRIVNVVILPAGRQKLMEIQASLNANVSEWGTALKSEEFDELAEALQTVSRILSKV